MLPYVLFLGLYEGNLVPVVVILRVLRPKCLVQPRFHAEIEHVFERSDFFRELFWGQLVDWRQGAAQNLEDMLRW